MRIGILGGGIVGLNAALKLAEEGHDVTVLEAAEQLGGLGTFFKMGDNYIDKFYHCIMPKDEHLLGLIDHLGLSDNLYWQKTFMGMIYESEFYPFNGPLDLLKFSKLSLFSRLRMGAGAVLMPFIGNPEKLDDVPIQKWLTSIFGKHLWQRFWKPLFSAKFGDAVDNLPALYLKARLGRESNVSDRAYLNGGLKRMMDTLAKRIALANGKILVKCKVSSIQQRDGKMIVTDDKSNAYEFDKVISTIPVPSLKQVLSEIDSDTLLHPVPGQGVVNALFLTKRPMSGNYWTPVIFSDTEFDGVVESSTLIKPEHYGGHHATYVMRYTSKDSELYHRNEEQVKAKWTEDFIRIHQHLGIEKEDIASVHIFKTPYVEPLYPLGYNSKKPSFEIIPGLLYAATTAHVYPGITSLNSSLEISKQCLEALKNE
ncbi:MAG: FAD-dependent oxidoreductase [Pseudomonadota bacterium]